MYAELQCKTNFSFLTGASHPEELIHRAAELGLSAIAITDHDGVYAIPKAYWAAKHYPALKLIVGTSLALSQHPRLTLLAQDRQAYSLLCRMITTSHQDKPKGKASLTIDELQHFMTRPGHDGLLALPHEQAPFPLLKTLFDDRLYIPVSRFKDGHDQQRLNTARKLAQRWGSKIAASNDVHYHVPERQKLHDVLTAIRHGQSVQSSGFRLFSNNEHYLKSPQLMQQLFADMPEALSNTLEIAERCTFCPSELRYRYPSEWIPQNHTAQSYLEHETWQGARIRYHGKIPKEVARQIRHELMLTKNLDFADYFLTIYDIVQFARKQKILCQGRGSAANSVMCYCLGITAIDPVQMNLLFERFISAERGEPPDIDVDFEHERREEVIHYIYDKYGRDRAAMISAVVTYRRRQAFREVSKSLGLNIGNQSAKNIEKNFDSLAAKTNIPHCQQQVEELTEEMKGFPRHLSIHSGGFTLSADPIIDIVPVEPARMEGRTIIQWDKYDLDYLGLLKIDILSLGMLSTLRKSLDAIGMQLHEIPANDPKTFRMIQHADTVGTFQIESRAQISMLGRLLPKNFYDLVIQIAIVRPGPIQGKMVHPYLKRRRKIEEVDYPHPKLRPILGKTLGIPLFQEQVMKMAIELADFTPGEADELRRAIAAWRSEGSIEKTGARLMAGLQRNGLPQTFAERVFQQIKGFAQYGFPESHSASFALLAYASAYVKCHYPAIFLCALINSQPLGFYAVHTLIDDAKRHGVQILPVHPNQSQWDCTLENNAVRLGWRVVKGLEKRQAQQLINQRPFHDLHDFLRRVTLRNNIIHRLAMGNVFSCFGLDQRHSLWQILEYQLNYQSQQPNIFSPLPLSRIDRPVFHKLSQHETITEDYNTFHLSLHGHPMEGLRKALILPYLSTQMARQTENGQMITVCGLLLVRQRPQTAKGMTFGTLEDEFGFLDLAIPHHVFANKQQNEIFSDNCLLIIGGILQRDTHSISLLVQRFQPIWNVSESHKNALMIEPRQFYDQGAITKQLLS